MLPNRLARSQPILVRHDHVIAHRNSAQCFAEIERAKADLDRSPPDDAVFDYQYLIDQNRPSWDQGSIFVSSGDDVHFAGHSGHEVVGWFVHFQDNGVTLSFRI